ncbi:hypothetical protein UY3_18252 [Chelonia mydas]|uniref:Uncharacterized protein n=1 Tax=Chelonia mydas TaxID=8469 RepID=M7APJ7_CHEMY|nr:hypothetical protein UY3_18252 [Chelonia mydas]
MLQNITLYNPQGIGPPVQNAPEHHTVQPTGHRAIGPECSRTSQCTTLTLRGTGPLIQNVTVYNPDTAGPSIQNITVFNPNTAGPRAIDPERSRTSQGTTPTLRGHPSRTSQCTTPTLRGTGPSIQNVRVYNPDSRLTGPSIQNVTGYNPYAAGHGAIDPECQKCTTLTHGSINPERHRVQPLRCGARGHRSRMSECTTPMHGAINPERHRVQPRSTGPSIQNVTGYNPDAVGPSTQNAPERHRARPRSTGPSTQNAPERHRVQPGRCGARGPIDPEPEGLEVSLANDGYEMLPAPGTVEPQYLLKPFDATANICVCYEKNGAFGLAAAEQLVTVLTAFHPLGGSECTCLPFGDVVS